MTLLQAVERPGAAGAVAPKGAPANGSDAPADGSVAATTEPVVASRGGRRRRVPAPVVHIGRLLVVALIAEYLVVPELAGTRPAWHTLSTVDPGLLALGAALEAAALACYAQLGRRVLPEETAPGLWRILRIQLSTLSVSHTVPGGSAAGSSLGFRLLTAAGVDRADVGVALATQSLGSALVLNAILWIALVVSIPVWGFSPLYLTAAGVGAVLVGAFLALVLLFTRGQARAGLIIHRVAGRIPRVDPDAVLALFLALGERLRTLGRQRATLARAVGWAAANWLLDAAALWVFLGAFGHWTNPDGVVVAFGLANVAAALPLTPGGLGVVEATLTTALVGFDTPQAVALLGVVAYRLVNFWLPIPAGAAAYLSLQVDGRSARRARRGRRAAPEGRRAATAVPPVR